MAIPALSPGAGIETPGAERQIFAMNGIGIFLFASVAAFGTAVMVARVILNGLFWLVLHRRRP